MRYLLLFALVCSMQAATLYVSPTGNNSTGNGTEGNPWQTIRKGISEMSSGDTLTLLPGTYTENPIGHSETIPHGSTIRGVDMPVWKPNTVNGHGLRIIARHNVTLDGFVIDFENNSGWTWNNIKIEGVHNMVVTNMWLRDNRTQLLLAVGSGGPCLNLHIVDSQFSKFAQKWSEAPGGTSPTHGLYLSSLHDSIVERNIFFDGGQDPGVAGWGIHRYNDSGFMSTNGIVRHNIFTNSNQGVILGRKSVDWKVYNNLFVDMRSTAIRVDYDGSADNLIANNTVFRFNLQNSSGHYAIRIRKPSSEDNGPVNTMIVNNILWGAPAANRHTIDIDSAIQSAFITNNIIATTINDPGGQAVLSGNFTADPQFVNAPANLLIDDNSPAQHAGADLSPIFTDSFNNVERPQGHGFDIGAFEREVEGTITVPTIGLSVETGEGQANEANLSSAFITVTRIGSTSGALNVTYDVHESTTATADLHYAALSGSVTIPDGQSSAKVEIEPLEVGSHYPDVIVSIIVTPTDPITYEITTYSEQPFVTIKSALNAPGILRQQREPGKGRLNRIQP